MTKEEQIVPIIIPSLEPNDNLLNLVASIKDSIPEPIVIVNDGSNASYDHYYNEAERGFDCIVLKHDINCGKGRALKTAFDYCLRKWPKLIGVVTADSDGQHTCEYIKKCKKVLVDHPNDLVLGYRDFSGDNIPWKSKFGNTLTQKVCKGICGVDVHDTQTGLRGIPREFMKKLLNLPGERFEFETRMLVATKGSINITEFPIDTIYDSKENHATHFRPIVDSLKVYKIFFEMITRFLVSSLSSSVIDLVLFWIFCQCFKGVFPVLYIGVSTVLARIISATYNYYINYRFVFRSNEKHQESAIRYFILAVIQMICSAGLTTLGVTLLRKSQEVAIKIVVDVILFFISYSIQREIVYNKARRNHRHDCEEKSD